MTNGQPAATPAAVRQLDTPAASALADLAAIFDELRMVLRCCERLVSELSRSDGEPDDPIVESLWTTALLSYARCFSPGTRGMFLTEDDVTAIQLQGEVLEWHHALLRLREHYADTTANPRETFSVGVSQAPDGTPDGIAITSAPQPAVDDRAVRQTGAIAYELSRVVDERMSEHQERVLTGAQAMPKEDLDRLQLIDVSQQEPGTEP